MIGLAYLVFFAVYFVVSAVVIFFAWRFAKRRYQRGWAGGWLAVLVMYHLVFWDWIPVLVMHKYYCATQAGFWVYKTPEELLSAHPNIREEDWDFLKDEVFVGSHGELVRRYWESHSVYREVISERDFFHQIHRNEHKVVYTTDTTAEEVLSRAVEFFRGSRGIEGTGLSSFKFWLGAGKRSCGPDRDAGFERDLQNYLISLRLEQRKGDEK